jgi:hypothetical protein
MALRTQWEYSHAASAVAEPGSRARRHLFGPRVEAMIEWLSIALGLAGGAMLCLWVGKRAIPPLLVRSRRPELLVKLSLGGTAVAALPALLLSIVVGATLGMPWGTVGVVAGVALVFSLVLLAGTFAGVLLARYLT